MARNLESNSRGAALAARVVSVMALASSSTFSFAIAAPDTWLQVSLDVRRQRVKLGFLSLALSAIAFAEVSAPDHREPPAPWFLKLKVVADDAVRWGTRVSVPENFPPKSKHFWECFEAVWYITDEDLLIAVGAVICDERHPNQHQRPPPDSGLIAAF